MPEKVDEGNCFPLRNMPTPSAPKAGRHTKHKCDTTPGATPCPVVCATRVTLPPLKNAKDRPPATVFPVASSPTWTFISRPAVESFEKSCLRTVSPTDAASATISISIENAGPANRSDRLPKFTPEDAPLKFPATPSCVTRLAVSVPAYRRMAASSTQAAPSKRYAARIESAHSCATVTLPCGWARCRRGMMIATIYAAAL